MDPIPRWGVRWWFEDRTTGRITIAQFPNWPIFAVAGAWVVERIAEENSSVADAAGIATTALWVFWGTDELLRGVNPWRRLLGAAVLGWQAIRLVR